MRRLNSIGHLEKKPQCGGRVQLLFLTELVDRPPFNIFKNKKGPSFRCYAAIQQPGDAGVREARHNLPLLFESFDETGCEDAFLQDFERDALLVSAVGSFGQVHRTHASAPDFLDQPVVAEQPSREAGFCFSRCQVRLTRLCREDLAGLVLEPEQLLRFIADLFDGSLCAQIGRTFARRQRHSRFYQRANPRPHLRCHLFPSTRNPF